MVEYKKNKIVINGNEKTFNYDIRDVIEHNNKYYTSVDGVLFNKAKTRLIKYTTRHVDQVRSCYKRKNNLQIILSKMVFMVKKST